MLRDTDAESTADDLFMQQLRTRIHAAFTDDGAGSHGSEQTVARTADEFKAGFQIGGYTVVGRLGSGTYGEVYLAREIGTDRPVAIKVPRSRYSNSTAQAKALIREQQSLRQLSHPGIVTIYDFDQTEDGRALVVMEYIKGNSLRAFVG